MSSGLPELGSKISLISKADIRYEGQLFTVDPRECTIALAAVRSFGTEDRETQFPVAPQSQVFDYILFRGSDIKDIRVVSNVSAVPHDPAIMQLSVPPSLGQQPFQNQSFAHPVLGAMVPPLGQFNTPYSAIGQMGGLTSGLAPGINARNLSKQSSSEFITNPLGGPILSTESVVTDQGVHNDFIGGNSRSTTPVSRKSPTVDQGTQVGNASGKEDKKQSQKAIQPPSQQKTFAQQGQNRAKKDKTDHSQERKQSQIYQNRSLQQRNQQQTHNRGSPWNQRGNNQRQRGRGRGVNQGMFRPQPTQQNQKANPGNKPKNTLKFESDYDFEQANTEFEELRSKFAKAKISEGEPAVAASKPEEVNGESEKKDDSGNETGAGETEHEEEHESFYDRSKSFFDNISCEALERSKGRTHRHDWRMERKLNSETFGWVSARWGVYRGRGGYYNRGMYRGGFRGNYRNQRNPRSNQIGHQQQSTAEPPANANTAPPVEAAVN